jgi:hypothetical protein
MLNRHVSHNTAIKISVAVLAGLLLSSIASAAEYKVNRPGAAASHPAADHLKAFPLVVYAPKDAEVRYRVWSSRDNMEAIPQG